MATPIYLWLKDDNGIQIKGSVEMPSRLGCIEVTAHEHEVYLPTDGNTGQVTGPRVHTPFIFTKELDSSTPYLYRAVTDGQTLRSAEFKWYRTSNEGEELECFSALLEGVRVVSVSPRMFDMKAPENQRYTHLESVALRYQTITWSTPGNVKHSDDWNARKTR